MNSENNKIIYQIKSTKTDQLIAYTYTAFLTPLLISEIMNVKERNIKTLYEQKIHTMGHIDNL